MFGSFLKIRLPGRPPQDAAAPPVSPDEIRRLILAALADCERDGAERIRQQARSMRSGTDLWLLRGDVYQLVACEHCEAEARRRVNDLLPAFEGWVPPRAMARL
jgi:hypothetical protein